MNPRFQPLPRRALAVRHDLRCLTGRVTGHATRLPHFRAFRRAALALLLALFCAALCPLANPCAAQTIPAWWLTRDVLTEQAPSDYSPANAGQLKHIATKAHQEMEANFPGGAGTAVAALVTAWQTPAATTNDYAIVNLGQLKTVAKPFYDRLIALHYVSKYPWEGNGTASDYSPALIGQVKYLFSFDTGSKNFSVDSNNNGIPDWWEYHYLGALITSAQAGADANGDGLTTREDFEFGLNPATNAFPRPVLKQTYSYDAAGRLIGAGTGGSSSEEAFSLDAEGNLLQSK